MQRDATGFPLSVKPSHLFGAAEQMDTAEILSMIVDRACLYVPESPVGETFKRSKGLTRRVNAPKEALAQVEASKEAPTSVEIKVPVVVSSDLIRSK